MSNSLLEIERKFLLRQLPDDLDRDSGVAIRQGYLCDAGNRSVRLRQRGEHYFLTCKKGVGIVRDEAEVEIDKAQFQTLWPLTDGARVCKVRYRYPLSNGLEAELDVFEQMHAPLKLVEVEFADSTQARTFKPLAFFGPDVTTDSRFLNATLAREGLPESWQALLDDAPASP